MSYNPETGALNLPSQLIDDPSGRYPALWLMNADLNKGTLGIKYWEKTDVTYRFASNANRNCTFVDEVPEEVPDEDPEVERVPPAELTRMIGELPEGYRLVLNMFVFEQRSHKEIAEQLGIKESSSASQYLRAKKLLAKKINDYLNTLNEKEYE